MDPTRRRFPEASEGADATLANPSHAIAHSQAFEEYRTYDAVGLAELVRRGDASPAGIASVQFAMSSLIGSVSWTTAAHHRNLAMMPCDIAVSQTNGKWHGPPQLQSSINNH